MRYASARRGGIWMLVIGCGLLGFIGRAAVAEDPAAGGATPDSYLSIPARNAFGIRTPTPSPPLTTVAQVVPPNLFLTGLTLAGGVKRAYLIGEKAGGKQPEYLSVEEGYERDGLEVLGIDPRRQSVRVRNGGNEVTLNFKDNGRKPGAVPAGSSGPTQPVPVAVSAPTIIYHGGGARDDAGATPGATPQPASAASPDPTSSPSASRRGAVNSGSGNGNGNPQRPSVPVPPVPVLPGR